MDFENCEAFVLPFSVPKKSAWKNVIRYLSEEENTPVDAICNSRVVSINKEYYPVERLEIIYTAKWNAISVFKEYWTEQKTHYERAIHYFDRLGIEHEHAGFDYFDTKSGKWKNGAFNPIASRIKGYSGKANTIPWNPQEVTVAVTEDIPNERETGRKKNSGNVNGSHIYLHSKGYPFFDSLFSDLTEKAEISYSEEAVNEGTVMQQPNPFRESDFNSVLSKVESDAKNQCIQQIPGQAYADFCMDFDSNEILHRWYYPVYHIIYEFKKQKYECFVSGCQEGYVYGQHDPQDDSIESIKQQYDNQCSDLKNKKKKCWLKFIWIWLGTCAVYSLVIPGIVALLLSVIGEGGLAVTSVLYIAFIGLVIYWCWKNYKDIKNIKEEIRKNNDAKEKVVPVRQAKKKAILSVILDDNLNDSEKTMRCEEILNDSISYR